MQTVEIPPSAWAQALDAFSAIHEGWLVSLDMLAPDLGAQPELRDMPLLGIVAEGGSGGAISICAARSPAEHITHIIHSPTRVRIERTDEGADVALQIESADGTHAILRFRAVALPETVDGVVHR